MQRWIQLILFILLIFAVFCSKKSQEQHLEDSNRHHEWVQIKHNQRVVHAFLIFPEVKDRAESIVVIHENRGLTEWVRNVADRLAGEGYIAIAPDLLSGMAPGGGKTSDFENSDAAREAIYNLAQNQVTADLNAVADYVSDLPAANGKIAVAGFCWGGSQSFYFVTKHPDLTAAYIFYGTPPDSIDRIQAPVFGFYGGNDARVTSTVETTKEKMQRAGEKYEPVIYEGVGMPSCV